MTSSDPSASATAMPIRAAAGVRSTTSRRLVLLVAALLVVAGCDERVAVNPPRPAPPPMPANAWLQLSDSGARAGDVILVSAYARSREGGAIGSFTARLLYDSLQLQVIEADSIGDATLRAVNPVTGEHRIAGASARGIDNGLLFRFRARVLHPAGLSRIALVLDELHSQQFAELTEALVVRDGRDALFSGMRGVRVKPAAEAKP